MSEIARMMGHNRQTIQRMANRFVKDGCLSRQHNPAHRRAPLLALTNKGQKALAGYEENLNEAMRGRTRDMSNETLLVTMCVLERLACG